MSRLYFWPCALSFGHLFPLCAVMKEIAAGTPAIRFTQLHRDQWETPSAKLQLNYLWYTAGRPILIVLGKLMFSRIFALWQWMVGRQSLMGINCRYFIVRQLKNPLWAPSKIANSAKRVGVTDTNRLKQQCKLTEDFLAEMSLCLSLVGNQRQPTGLWFSCQMPVMSLVTVGRLDQRRTLVKANTFEL